MKLTGNPDGDDGGLLRNASPAAAYLATPKSMSWRNTSPPFSLA